MKIIAVAFSCVSVLLAGCAHQSRSISNSGYVEPQSDSWPSVHPAPSASTEPFQYRGELSEFDVLGISHGEIASETEIARALEHARRVKLRRDSSILVIQSGAVFPDSRMVTELEKHFRVSSFSGVPQNSRSLRPCDYDSPDAQSYPRSLRLAAARGGNDTILCYWGILESETENLATKTVSWVPVATWFVPDEKQHLRIRLKVALVDVRTGDWTVFSPKSFDTSSLSVSPRRSAADQKQVEHLKSEAYAEAAKELVRLYSEVASVE